MSWWPEFLTGKFSRKALASRIATRSRAGHKSYCDACFRKSATSCAVSRDGLLPKRAVT
jgi:hypothetical protein